MELITTVAAMMEQAERWQRSGAKVGLVPTMGYLHDGHISLARQARAENDIALASIFVNPLQFGPREDFGRYPRNMERDLELLKEAGLDAVFNPSVEEMYPTGFDASVEVSGITDVLEGAHRPGHFKGVTTVVAMLFNLVRPNVAYFGQKDAQQVAVIKKMVRDLNFPLQITVCPIVREPDGLAMSSRNVYLSPEDRAGAIVLYRALLAAKLAWEKGDRNGETLRATMNKVLAGEPLAKPDYTSAANPLTLAEYEGEIPAGQGALLSMAVRFGTTRLIDNFLLEA